MSNLPLMLIHQGAFNFPMACHFSSALGARSFQVPCWLVPPFHQDLNHLPELVDAV